LIEFIKKEYCLAGKFVRSYGREIIVLASACLFFSLCDYHHLGSQWLDHVIYYGILPVFVILVILGKNPLDFGLRPGDYKKWVIWVVAAILVLTPILWFSAQLDTLQSYYLREDFNFINYFLLNCLMLFCWEFIFRGYLLFGLKRRFKAGSILIQMVPFVMTHIGKPEPETISTIITGILFGYICYRYKSFWPAFLIHLFINIFFVAAVNLH
jgi:membrane protease YdiL (CAAX protease family)